MERRVRIGDTHPGGLIEECQLNFSFQSADSSDSLIESRKLTFVRKYRAVNNITSNVCRGQVNVVLYNLYCFVTEFHLNYSDLLFAVNESCIEKS